MDRRWIEEALDVANRKIAEMQTLTEEEFRREHEVQEGSDTFANMAGHMMGTLQIIKQFILRGIKDE